MDITFEASTLTASAEDRTIRGMLVPYDVEGNTNLGRFTVPRGSLELPRDPAQMGVNVEHVRESAFGGGVELADTPEGVVFAARAADTPEGDQALADVASGKRRSWSVEAAGLVIEKGRAIAGRIFGAALVEKPAFPGAVLLASLNEDEEFTTATATTTDPEGDPEQERTETVETHVDEYVDEDGNTVRTKTTTTTVKEGNTTTVTTVTETVEPEPEPTTDTTEKEEPIVTTLTASARRGATRPAAAPIRTEDRPQRPDLGTLYAALSDARTTGTPEAMDTLMAALTDIKTSGSLGPAAGGGNNKGLPDNWMGQLWDGREYDRKYINLHAMGTDISARGKRGFRARRGTKAAPVASYGGNWSGDLTAISSANAYIEESASRLHKFALAEAIAREFFDLPGGAEFIEAFFKLIVEDYAVWSDLKALSVMLEAAGPIVAPKDHLSGYAATNQYPQSMVMLIQGTRHINRKRDTATYAVVNETAYDELIHTPKDLVPEFVSFDIHTESRGTADNGKLIVVEGDDADFVNLAGNPLIKADTPAVLVGAQRAIEFDELGSTPLTVDALEIARGGIDRATHGYLQDHVVRAESLVLIGEAPAAG